MRIKKNPLANILSDFDSSGKEIDWDLIDNNTSALSFDADGASGIINIVTTDGAEKVEIGYDMDVAGDLDITGDLTMTGSILLPDGAKAAPALAFASDTDTGIYSDGEGKINISIGGSEHTEFKSNAVTFQQQINSRGRIYDSGGPVQLGTAATTGHSLATGDVLVGGALEVDGEGYFDAALNADGGIRVSGDGSGYLLRLGTINQYSGTMLRKDDDGLHWSVNSSDGKQNRNIIITDNANVTKDHDHDTLSADPTLFIHSVTDPDTNNTQWLSLTHNQTNGVIGLGTGNLIVQTGAGQGVLFDTATTDGKLLLTDEAGGALVLDVGLGAVYANTVQSKGSGYPLNIGVADRSSTAASNGVSIYSGAQTNAGDYDSGAVNIYTGDTTTDGDTGDVVIYTGTAGAGAADAGDVLIGVHGDTTGASIKVNGSDGSVDMGSLPTSDPGVAGRLWVDTTAGYVVKVSQG